MQQPPGAPRGSSPRLCRMRATPASSLNPQQQRAGGPGVGAPEQVAGAASGTPPFPRAVPSTPPAIPPYGAADSAPLEGRQPYSCTKPLHSPSGLPGQQALHEQEAVEALVSQAELLPDSDAGTLSTPTLATLNSPAEGTVTAEGTVSTRGDPAVLVLPSNGAVAVDSLAEGGAAAVPGRGPKELRLRLRQGRALGPSTAPRRTAGSPGGEGLAAVAGLGVLLVHEEHGPHLTPQVHLAHLCLSPIFHAMHPLIAPPHCCCVWVCFPRHRWTGRLRGPPLGQ